MSHQRVRARLLVLLWIWAVMVFVVVDLFWNVDEFDRVRPRARLYRAMRFSAHQMAGEPYAEVDEFGRRAREPIVAPPLPLAKRLRGPISVAEVRAWLGYADCELEPLLERLKRRPRPELAPALIDAADSIPHELLGAYALAAAACVARMEHSSTRLRLADRTLEALARLLFRPEPRRRDWAAARFAVERIGWALPDYRASPEGAARLRALHAAVADALAPSEAPLRDPGRRAAAASLAHVLGPP